MKKISVDGNVVAIFHKRGEWKEGLDFITPDETFIQVGTWWYGAGKDLKAHKHIVNERLVNMAVTGFSGPNRSPGAFHGQPAGAIVPDARCKSVLLRLSP